MSGLPPVEGPDEHSSVASEEQRATHPSVHWQQGRRTLPWTNVLGIIAGVLAVWTVLNSSTLLHNAEVSPIGVRRSVSLAVLRPIASVANALQITELEKGANLALGRTALGAQQQAVFITTSPVVTTPKQHEGGVTTTTIDPLRGASAAAPVRILLLGDSLGLDLGGSLQNALASTGIVTATLDGKESTGLTRPDYFNWPVELASDMNALHPQVIVAMMGANDPQDFLIPGSPNIPYGTVAWKAEYERRAVAFIQEATSQGAKLVWVSLPSMQDPVLNAKIATINALQKQAAAQVPGVVSFDAGTVLGGPSMPYSDFVLHNGQNVLVRTPDGIHITPQGGDLLARSVMAQLKSTYGIPLP